MPSAYLHGCEPQGNTCSLRWCDWATQCRASHCIERPAHDRGQALGVHVFGLFAAKEHFCYLPGFAFERAEHASIEFFALNIPRDFDFWLRGDMRFWLRIGGGGEH